MAVTLASCDELLEGRTSQLGDDGVRTGDRVYSVRLDLTAATADEVAGIDQYVEFNLPVARWQRHPAFPAMTCRTVRLVPSGTPDAWTAVVGYSSAPAAARTGTDPTGTAGGAAGSQTPGAGSDRGTTKASLRPPEIGFAWRSTQRVVSKDLDLGSRVVNSVKDPFDPPVTADQDYTTVVIKFWRPAVWLTVNFFGYQNAINNAAYTLLGVQFPERTLRCRITGLKGVWDQEELPGVTPAVTSLTLVWEVGLELMYDPNTWDYKVLNAGRRARPAAGLPPAQVRDGQGQPAADPVMLNADGTKRDPAATPLYVTGRRYELANFAGLLS